MANDLPVITVKLSVSIAVIRFLLLRSYLHQSTLHQVLIQYYFQYSLIKPLLTLLPIRRMKPVDIEGLLNRTLLRYITGIERLNHLVLAAK